MKEITSECMADTLDKLDTNNQKALEVLRVLMCLTGHEELELCGINVSVVLDTVVDCLKANDDIFDRCR